MPVLKQKVNGSKELKESKFVDPCCKSIARDLGRGSKLASSKPEARVAFIKISRAETQRRRGRNKMPKLNEVNLLISSALRLCAS